MKKIVLIIGVAFLSSTLMAQNVGIGTTTPQAPFTVAPNKTVLFGSDTLNAGAKMMWLPVKGAFRVGNVTGNNWNADSIGLWSFASGFNTKAKEIFSTATGAGTTASGNASTAMGGGTTASGGTSTAMGANTTATGIVSTAMGRNTVALGNYSTAMGGYTTASGIYATAMGNYTTASGNYSTAMGISTTASGSISTAMGRNSIASGDNSTTMGLNTLASGIYSTAMGSSTEATGDYSTTAGNITKALGDYSTAIGAFTIASGASSTAMGFFTTASADYSTAMGSATQASGTYSTAMGHVTTARSLASVSMGLYNDSIASSNKTSWVSTDPLLIIGNGTLSNARSNALVVYKNGNTDINGYTQLGKASEGAPAIKTKKIIGYSSPTSANPNTFTFVPHGLTASKILSISVLINASGNYEIMPQSTQTGYTYSVNTDPSGGGQANIAVGVKSAAESSSVMGRPIKFFITYEE